MTITSDAPLVATRWTPYAHRMKRGLSTLLAVGIALVLLAPTPAVAAPDPCAGQLSAFAKADKAVVKAGRAYRAAKTRSGKAKRLRQLNARKRVAKIAARAHDRCMKANPPRTPGLRVTPSPRINQPIFVDFMPGSAPPSGTEFHIAVVVPAGTQASVCGVLYAGTIPATAEGFTSEISPTDALAGLLQPASYWCPGTAYVVVRVRAIGSAPTDLGVEQARVAILISADQ